MVQKLSEAVKQFVTFGVLYFSWKNRRW